MKSWGIASHSGLFVLVAVVAGGMGCAAPSVHESPRIADLIVLNAQVITVDEQRPRATAFAVEGGVFLAVGDDADALAHRGEHTRIIDAGRRTVIPGLNDSHLHATRGGRFYNLELRWDGVDSLARGLDMIRDQAERTPDGELVRVIGGW
jgi:predicted amidohydrolase YtcJ